MERSREGTGYRACPYCVSSPSSARKLTVSRNPSSWARPCTSCLTLILVKIVGHWTSLLMFVDVTVESVDLQWVGEVLRRAGDKKMTLASRKMDLTSRYQANVVNCVKIAPTKARGQRESALRTFCCIASLRPSMPSLLDLRDERE